MMIQGVGVQSAQFNKNQNNNQPAFCSKGKILDELGFVLADESGRVGKLLDIIQNTAGKNDEVIVQLQPVKDIYSACSCLQQQEAIITSVIKARKGFKAQTKVIDASIVEPGPDEFFPKIEKELLKLQKQYPVRKGFFSRFQIFNRTK